MKKMHLLSLFFCFTFSASVWAIDHHKLISLNFKEAPLSLVLQHLADLQDLDLIFDEQNQQPITLRLHNITWKNALDHIVKLGNLHMEIDDTILLITSPPALPDIFQSEAWQEKERENRLPLKMVTLTPNYYSAKQLEAFILQYQLLSERGKVFLDDNNNRLIVHDIAERISHIGQLIKKLDKAEQQIEISAHIVTIGRDTLDELGVNWGYKGHASQTLNQLGFALPVANATSQLGLQVAKFNGHFLSLELSALEAENNVDIIANPRLLTRNNQTASIKQGTEIPYEIYSGDKDDKVTIEFKEAVLGLEVTPRILNNGLLELTLFITQNAIGQSIKMRNGSEVLAIDKQEIKTQVIVKNGETLVLGGIFQQQKKQEQKSVPGLSKIPVLGHLFKHNIQNEKKREFIIFITPKIEIL